jgi:hypothetical protein
VFKAVQSAKVRVNEDVGPVRCGDVFKRNEDFLTAAVFSRLLYMPTDALNKLLRVSDARLGEVLASEFWPEWSVDSQNPRRRVEPDVYIQFDSVDLIVEAKLGDVAGYQMADQWAREWAAWYQNRRNDERPGLLLGIGGLGRTESEVKAEVTRLVEQTNSLLHARLPPICPINADGLAWQGLYDRLGILRKEVSPQLLTDLLAILGYFGSRGHEYLADLSEVASRAMARPIRVGSTDVIGRWHGAPTEPDWIAASRGLRPISDASITVLAEVDRGWQ